MATEIHKNKMRARHVPPDKKGWKKAHMIEVLSTLPPEYWTQPEAITVINKAGKLQVGKTVSIASLQSALRAVKQKGSPNEKTMTFKQLNTALNKVKTLIKEVGGYDNFMELVKLIKVSK